MPHERSRLVCQTSCATEIADTAVLSRHEVKDALDWFKIWPVTPSVLHGVDALAHNYFT